MFVITCINADYDFIERCTSTIVLTEKEAVNYYEKVKDFYTYCYYDEVEVGNTYIPTKIWRAYGAVSPITELQTYPMVLYEDTELDLDITDDDYIHACEDSAEKATEVGQRVFNEKLAKKNKDHIFIAHDRWNVWLAKKDIPSDGIVVVHKTLTIEHYNLNTEKAWFDKKKIDTTQLIFNDKLECSGSMPEPKTFPTLEF